MSYKCLNIEVWSKHNLTSSQSYQTFFFVKRRFFHFLLLSLAISKYILYFLVLKTLKLKKRKSKKRRYQSITLPDWALHSNLSFLDHFSKTFCLLQMSISPTLKKQHSRINSSIKKCNKFEKFRAKKLLIK